MEIPQKIKNRTNARGELSRDQAEAKQSRLRHHPAAHRGCNVWSESCGGGRWAEPRGAAGTRMQL